MMDGKNEGKRMFVVKKKFHWNVVWFVCMLLGLELRVAVVVS